MYFRYISPYPLKDKLHSERELREFEFEKSLNFPAKLRKVEVIETPYELVISALNEANSSIISKFRDYIEAVRNYEKAKQHCHPLQDIPCSAEYQSHPERANIFFLNEEIKKKGVHLWGGQVVFHGGSCPDNPLDSFITNKPLSTSFCPSIASWHAYNDRLGKWDPQKTSVPEETENPAIWILEISPFCPKKAIIFPEGGANMADEMEVLFEEGIHIIPQRITTSQHYKKITIIEAIIT